MFASRNFGEKDVDGSYYGSLAYADLWRELRSRKQCRERYMEILSEVELEADGGAEGRGS